MAIETPAADLERRKKVRLRLRSDLNIAPHRYEGRTYFIVKDPVSLRYYRFKEQEHFLIQLMDGTRTLDDAQKEFEQRFRPDRLPLEDLEGFAQQLLTVGLAHNESPQAGKQLFDRRKKRRRSEWMAALTNILYIKIPVIDPDKLLTRMLNKGIFPGFLQTPIHMLYVAWLALCLVGLLLFAAHVATYPFESVSSQLPRFVHFFTVKTVLHMLLGLAAVKLIHGLAHGLRFIFTSWFLGISIGVMAAAVLLVLTHFETFRDKLPSYHEFFSFKTVAYMWIALGAVKVIHEFGHGLSCKAYGGEVHEMGALFLCLSPCLYCNVSDAWTMPSKWKRIIISFAGIYVELIIAAISTFVWWNTPAQPFINNLSLSLMVVCSISTVIFNGNPLMRYDGYYILADWIEIPNLRDRSNRFIKNLVLEHCMGVEVQPEPYMSLDRRILFVVYAITSYIYRWVVTFSILYFLYMFLKPYKLGAISALLAVAAAASMAGWPLYRLGKSLYKRGRMPDMKSKRVYFSLGALAILVLLFFVVPLPVSRVRQTALVQLPPSAVEKVFPPNPGGILESMPVRYGQPIQKGDVLARFRNLDLENQLEEARTEYSIREVSVQELQKQLQATIDLNGRGEINKSITAAEGERATWQGKILVLEQMIKRLELKAPRSGVILNPPPIDEVGKLWDKEQETPFCSIGDPRQLWAVMPVPPADYYLLKEDLKEMKGGLDVTIRVQGRADETWRGRVAALPASEAREVPIQLTTRAGGPLAIKPNPRGNKFEPQSQQWLVAIDFVGVDPALCPGTLAQVKVHCKWRTGAWWVWRTISSTFDLGLL